MTDAPKQDDKITAAVTKALDEHEGQFVSYDFAFNYRAMPVRAPEARLSVRGGDPQKLRTFHLKLIRLVQEAIESGELSDTPTPSLTPESV